MKVGNIYMEISLLTIITGHYGSGKTNLSVNMAMDISGSGKKCTVIDLDIVNPYFRTADFGGLFSDRGIELYTPVYANSNLDIPAINIPLSSILEGGGYVIIDVGGDDEGAKALGRYAPVINAFHDTSMLYVINKYRYLTKEAAGAVTVMREIEQSSGICCTGIVNNSNLGTQTDKTTVADSIGFASEVCELSGLGLKATAAVSEALSEDTPCAYPIRRYVKLPWENLQ